jgi:formylglycine-generating enzyme required for sulfatase activity
MGDNPDDRALLLGEKPHWTALACLQPGEVYNEIRQTLAQLALQTPNPTDRFRLAALVESYGDFLADRGYQPMLLAWANRVAEGEPIDASAAAAEQLQPGSFSVSWVEFEVATVAFGVEAAPPVAGELTPFEVETVTVNDQGEVVATATHTVAYFEEPLTEGVPPLRLVAIPSGEFMMGSPEAETERSERESPQHLVKVPPFFMGQTPVTQAQWQAVAALPQQERELSPAPASFKRDNCPVEQVSWYEAVEFCARLSELTGRTYRLPTEAEWEYACRADTTTPFYVGETLTTELANYDGSVFLNEPKGQSRKGTTLVGQFAPNAFGLYDLHGNVWEWCLDHWHGNYDGAPTDGSAWLTENEEAGRVRRGGSWFFNPRDCRSAYRGYNYPGTRYEDFGFRVICEARSP